MLSFLVAFASAFMNNVGALALVMPIAFASLLGGMITLIGTPPNIIIAQFRAQVSGQAFGMFDYAPVGLLLTVAGILFISLLGWRLLPKRKNQKSGESNFEIDDYISEVQVVGDSKLRNKTIGELEELTKADIQILGLVRKDKRIHAPGLSEKLLEKDVISTMGCLPLADRGLRIAYKTKIPLALSVFAAAIALIMSGLLPVYIAFLMAAVLLVLTGVLPVRNMYSAVDWSIIVLLAAMIPLGSAFESSGAASRISSLVIGLGEELAPYWVLALIMTVTMLLSGLINNAATVILMAPVAIGVAGGLGLSIDTFLMTVAVGGSAAFLTPVGHQSNTLVMGPGSYRFIDYFRMGLPLTLIIIFGGVPLIMLFWPV